MIKQMVNGDEFFGGEGGGCRSIHIRGSYQSIAELCCQQYSDIYKKTTKNLLSQQIKQQLVVFIYSFAFLNLWVLIKNYFAWGSQPPLEV